MFIIYWYKGAVITKYSNNTEEAFEFIEILIDDTLPYFSELNISITVMYSILIYNYNI